MKTNRGGKLLAQLREERGLSQARLAEVLGTSQQAIADRENGRTPLSLVDVARLSDFFHVAEQDFLGPPRHPSRFGFTGEPGPLPQPQPEVMAAILEHVDTWLQAHGAALSNVKRASLVSQIYSDVMRRAEAAGTDPEDVPLRDFDSWIRMVADTAPRRSGKVSA